jgi:hypothetical protein
LNEANTKIAKIMAKICLKSFISPQLLSYEVDNGAMLVCVNGVYEMQNSQNKAQAYNRKKNYQKYAIFHKTPHINDMSPVISTTVQITISTVNTSSTELTVR